MKRRFAVVLAVLMVLTMVLPMQAMAFSCPIQSDTSTIISMTPTSVATISPTNPAVVGAYNITYEIDPTSTAYGQIYTTTAVYGSYTVPVAKVTALTAGTLKINAKLGGTSGITVGTTTVTARSLLASGAATMNVSSSTLAYGQSTQITSSSGQAIVAATSDHPEHVSVTSTGLATCRSSGTGYATIGCYDAAGNYGSVRIFFGSYPTNTVSSTSTQVAVGGTLQLYLGGLPDHCASSNDAVATVSATGLVTGKANGVATIYCYKGTTSTGSFTVTVGTGVGATGSTGGVQPLKANISVGETTMLTGATIISAFTTNNNIISVTSNGMITGLSNGTASITYVTSNGISGTATVIVGTATGGVTLTKNPIAVGEMTMLTGASFAMVQSGNPAVATATTTGAITGVSNGTAVITYVTTTGTSGTVTVNVGGTSTGATGDPNMPAPTKSYTIAAGSYKTFKYSGQNVAKAWAYDPSVVSASLLTASDGYTQARFTGLKAGTTVVYMQTANGAVSAISFTVTGGDSTAPEASTGSTGVVNSGDPDLRVICRKGAGSNFGVLATLSSGVKVKITGSDGEYFKVSFSSGSKTYSGYIKAKYVSVS